MTTPTAPCGVRINDRLSEEDLALPDDQRNVSRREIVHKVGDTVKFMVPRLHLRRGGGGEVRGGNLSFVPNTICLQWFGLCPMASGTENAPFAVSNDIL